MSTEAPTVGTPESTSEIQESQQFGSLQEAAAAVRSARRGEEKPVAQEPEAEAEEVTELEDSTDSTELPKVGESTEDEGEVTETEEAEESTDVLSQIDDIDFDSLDQEVQDAIAEKLEVKSHKAFAEMRTKLKAAESELNELRESQSSEVIASIEGSNQFSSITDASEIKSKVDQAQVDVEYFTNELLHHEKTKYDETKGEDVPGIELNGQFYDKDSVLKHISKQKEVLKDGKSRSKQLDALSEIQSKQDELIAKSKAKLGITPDSKVSAEYDALLADSDFKTLQRAMPGYAKKLIDVFGQAAVAKVGTQDGKISIPRKAPKGKTRSVNPSAPNASAPSKTGTSAQLAALAKRLKSGVSRDEALQIARQQRALRKNS